MASTQIRKFNTSMVSATHPTPCPVFTSSIPPPFCALTPMLLGRRTLHARGR
ncbi:hypothetical protein BD414DRAFT_498669 [Trametes punicea]|nr:hypothetical protein BD414DRAFT_498669 [Trametes punicea]